MWPPATRESASVLPMSFVAGDPPLPESPNFMGTPPHEAYPDAHSPGHQSSGPFPRGLVWLFGRVGRWGMFSKYVDLVAFKVIFGRWIGEEDVIHIGCWSGCGCCGMIWLAVGSVLGRLFCWKVGLQS